MPKHKLRILFGISNSIITSMATAATSAAPLTFEDISKLHARQVGRGNPIMTTPHHITPHTATPNRTPHDHTTTPDYTLYNSASHYTSRDTTPHHTCQEELKKSNVQYLAEHPELKNIIADFTAAGNADGMGMGMGMGMGDGNNNSNGDAEQH